MPALKVIGQPVFGWVDARSNPINMPSQRFLRVRNWVPHPDGHLELRDGYSLVSGISPSPAGAGAIHSVYPFQVQTRTVDTTGVTVTVQSDSVPLMLLGNYYVVLVPLNTAGAPAGASKEFGPLVVGAGQAILFTGLLYDANTTGWRAYWGILPGGENNYASVDLTSSTPDELFIRGFLPPYPSGRPPAPKGTKFLLFWQGTTPKVLRLDDLTVTTPTIRGAAIASSARWSYGLGKTGFIYMHNGTDSKFFDSVTFRDIGLPTLSPAQLAAIKVGPGISAPASTEAQAVALSVVSQTGASWGSPGYIYLAYFDTATNLVPCLEPLGGGLYPAGTSSDQTLQMLGLPSSPVSTVVGLITATPAGFTGMRYGSYWWNSPSGNPVCAWTQ